MGSFVPSALCKPNTISCAPTIHSMANPRRASNDIKRSEETEAAVGSTICRLVSMLLVLIACFPTEGVVTWRMAPNSGGYMFSMDSPRLCPPVTQQVV
jgi:hypothetical protein